MFSMAKVMLFLFVLLVMPFAFSGTSNAETGINHPPCHSPVAQSPDLQTHTPSLLQTGATETHPTCPSAHGCCMAFCVVALSSDVRPPVTSAMPDIAFFFTPRLLTHGIFKPPQDTTV